MKVFYTIILIIILLSCQDNNFVKGNCVQKPDEGTVWKIVQIKDKKMTLVQSAPQAAEIAREVEQDNQWIKTKCKN